jgi:hypothetical protein
MVVLTFWYVFVFQDLFKILQINQVDYESIDEIPNFTNICIFRGENAYLWRNFNVICSDHTFFHIFSKLLPQSMKFRGWDRFDGIRRIHYPNDQFLCS